VIEYICGNCCNFKEGGCQYGLVCLPGEGGIPSHYIAFNDKVINKKEMVNHPSHYNMGKYEAIDVIEDWQLNFNLGNTVKYISRAGHKDDIVQDLKKALWYLEREIKRLEK
jgi:hypothetical protein